MASDIQTKHAMDNMYRWTRHVYDASRKYYLLGRDRLIEKLNAQEGERVIEVGCGTARNLIKMARRYPHTTFCGLDASDEMLKTAAHSISRRNMYDSIMLAQGYAQNFDPKREFDLPEPPHKLVYSYALSIIPPWQESIDHALTLLPKGGEMHIVDFGGMERQPRWFRGFIFWWLSLFHVYHKPEILGYLQELEANKKGALEVERLYGGYAYRAVFTKS